MKSPRHHLLVAALVVATVGAGAAQSQPPVAVAVPANVKPGSINCEDVAYPYPVKYFALTLYGQDLRMAYMDVVPDGVPNGHTVVLLHGNNFAGFYFGGLIDALRKEGFRVIAPDQIGYGRSTKAIIYSLQLLRLGEEHAAAPAVTEHR